MPPLPKKPGERRRRNASPGFIQLDPAGRSEPAPEWPLERRAVDEIDELEERKWRALWELPQALEWDRMHCQDDVALYVRVFVLCTLDPKPTMLAELRRLDSCIGVSPRAMQVLRWEVLEGDAEIAAVKTLPAPAARRTYVPAKTG